MLSSLYPRRSALLMASASPFSDCCSASPRSVPSESCTLFRECKPPRSEIGASAGAAILRDPPLLAYLYCSASSSSFQWVLAQAPSSSDEKEVTLSWSPPRP